MGPTNSTPTATSPPAEQLKYQHGWGNTFRSESIPNSLPKLGHNPRDVPYGLYTEGITGSAFTAPRKSNRRSWFYRVRPSVVHFPYAPYAGNKEIVSDFSNANPEISTTPQQLRWDLLSVKGAKDLDWVDGWRTICGTGDASHRNGCAIHFYEFGKDMKRKAFYNADGDILFLPVKGALLITTEFGKLYVPPKFLAVVQRSMKFTVQRADGAEGDTALGYMVESFKGSFELPELGPIGGNGLANLEDFQFPTAAYEDEDEDWTIVTKFQGNMFAYKQDHSPFDVVAWMGNYVPFRFDMTRFNTMGSISYDHPDPSISCCFTVPSDTPGTGVLDFMVFGERWSAVEETFRPAWFHRNIMAEFMAAIDGMKAPNNGCNLHNCSSAHGPAGDVTNMMRSEAAPTGPQKALVGTQLIMVETSMPMSTTKWAMDGGKLQDNYWKDMWQSIKRDAKLPASGAA